MSEPVTPERLAQIRQLADQATAGPWGWRGHDDGQVELCTLHSGYLRVIAAQRSEPCVVELADGSMALTIEACVRCIRAFAEPEVEHLDRCERPENLGTVWLWDKGFISPANKWAVREQPYRSDVASVDHPDARFIAAAREIVPELANEVDRLLQERAELMHTLMAETERVVEGWRAEVERLRARVAELEDDVEAEQAMHECEWTDAQHTEVWRREQERLREENGDLRAEARRLAMLARRHGAPEHEIASRLVPADGDSTDETEEVPEPGECGHCSGGPVTNPDCPWHGEPKDEGCGACGWTLSKHGPGPTPGGCYCPETAEAPADRVLSPEALGLERNDPAHTYLDGAYEVWIGPRWDLAREGDRWQVYRKGNWQIAVGSFQLALAIVADDLGKLATAEDDRLDIVLCGCGDQLDARYGAHCGNCCAAHDEAPALREHLDRLAGHVSKAAARLLALARDGQSVPGGVVQHNARQLQSLAATVPPEEETSDE